MNPEIKGRTGRLIMDYYSSGDFSRKVRCARSGLLAAAIVLLNGCAPFSSNAKYLYDPDVKTCAHGSYLCKVNEPLPKSVEISSKEDNQSANTLSLPALETIDAILPDSGSGIAPAPGSDWRVIKTVTVTQATKYARDMEGEYAGAKAEYGSISSSFGTLLIPIGGAALALGAEGVGATTVSALGFGSATILGLGYWLSNPPREKVYMTGASALECLIGTMQPFDIEQMDFKAFTGDIGYWRNGAGDGMEGEQHTVLSQGDLLGSELVKATSNAEIASSPEAKPTLCYAERALLAASAGGQAASKAYDAALKYDQFSTRWAGNAMVNVANTINIKVSAAMTTNEPDLHSLASNLSSAIPTSAQGLAGISSASSATAAAVAATKSAAISKPVQPKPQGLPGPPLGRQGPRVAKGGPSLSQDSVDQLNKLRDSAENLVWESSKLNWWTETVVDLTPDDIKPKTDACTNLFSDPGAPPDTMTLNPDGYIELTPGGPKATVTISGGKSPYAVRLMSDSIKGLTAATTYDSGKASIELNATEEAAGSSYPLLVNDSTGSGRLLVLVVKAKKDTPDGVDCSASKPGAANALAVVMADYDAAAWAALKAAKLAADAAKQKGAVVGAKSKTDAKKFASLAAADSANASIEASTAQAKAEDAAKMLAASSDSSVEFYATQAQDVSSKAKASADSAAKDAADAAKLAQ